MRRLSRMQIIAAAASVGAIFLAGLALLFLQTPVSQIRRSSPAGNVSVPTQAAPAEQVPQRAGSERRSVAADSSSTSESRTVQAQVPAELISHNDEPAHAKGSPPPEKPIAPPALLPDPATSPTAPQANTSPLPPNDTHREIVAVERSGVNIRSAPSASSRLVGSAPKGARFEVRNRSGHWIEMRVTA
jgi:hypothetical protein